MKPPGRDQFMVLLRDALLGGAIEKLTLGKPAGKDPTLVNLFVRPVSLKSGPRLAFVWHHKTKDVTKNHAAGEALAILEPMIGADFLDAHLFTAAQSAQLETGPGTARLKVKALGNAPLAVSGNDRRKNHPV